MWVSYRWDPIVSPDQPSKQEPPVIITSRSIGVVLGVASSAPVGKQTKVPMSPRGRRGLRYPPRINVAPGPVTVRSISSPKPGWSLADAVDLVRQGYSVAHAAKVTGWTAPVIAAQEEPRRNR
jgi:hypothetical protein